MKLIKNHVFHARMKHIKLNQQYIRERIEVGKIYMAYIALKEQERYIMIKPLRRTYFEFLKRMIRMHNIQKLYYVSLKEMLSILTIFLRLLYN